MLRIILAFFPLLAGTSIGFHSGCQADPDQKRAETESASSKRSEKGTRARGSDTRNGSFSSGGSSFQPAPQEGRNLEPDRRPGYVILAFEGFGVNPDPLGRRGWWRDKSDNGFELGQRGNQTTRRVPAVPGNGPSSSNNGIVDSVDMLVALLEEGYQKGFRRFIIDRPAGFSIELRDGIRDLPNASWYTFDPSVQRSLSERSNSNGSAGGLAWWIENHPGVTVGIYVGSRAGPIDSVIHDGRILDASRQEDVETVIKNIRPWAKIGVTEFWFDHVGGVTQNVPNLTQNVETIWRMNAHPQMPPGIRIGGEHGLVTKRFLGGGNVARSGDIDYQYAAMAPVYFEFDRIDYPGIDADRTWTPGDYNAEVNIGFDFNPTRRQFDRDDIAGFVDRGFTAWAWGASRPGTADESVEMLRWVYYDDVENPTLKPACLADLNMDGTINAADRSIIIASMNSPRDIVRSWHGDLNLSGRVDSADLALWDQLAADAGYTSMQGARCP